MEADKHYRVLQMTVTNYMGVESVELSPDGKSMVISGPNGAGKTSAGNAIFAAITGKLPGVEEPVKRGEEQAVISLDLGAEGVVELRVVRKFGKGQGVIVENADGSRLKSPQTILSAMHARFAVDPTAFPTMPAKEQLAVLRDLVTLDVDPDEMLAKIKDAEDSRRVAHRALKDAEGHLKALAVEAPAEDPGEKKSAAALMERRAAEAAKQKEKDDAHASATSTLEAAAELSREANEIRANCKEIQERIANLTEVLNEQTGIAKAKAKSAEEMYAKGNEEMAAVDAMPSADYTAIDAEIQGMDVHNEQVDRWQDLQEAKAALSKQKEEHTALDQQVLSLRKQLKSAIATADYPVEGLAFSDDMTTLLYEGVPISQIPTSEQNILGVKIAVAQNPQLRVLRIQHGNDLDQEHTQALLDYAKAEGFQVWFEKVADGGALVFTEVE